jgi:hypothetical protein
MIIHMQTQPGLAKGNHVHTCPECHEHEHCEMTCSIMPDMILDDGTLRGAYYTCSRCNALPEGAPW